jgi:hypothetical protein
MDKPRDETHEQFEERTWKERCHFDKDDIVFIPPMSFKLCIGEAAKYKGIQIPGRGKERYTKHFEAGILVTEPVSLGVKKKDVQGEWQFVPADGKPGGGRRVWKCFPVFDSWEGDISFTVLDDIIDPETFLVHLQDAGQFIGIGRFRPANRGFYGRFLVDSVEWSKARIAA